jgi:hypothetical protein
MAKKGTNAKTYKLVPIANKHLGKRKLIENRGVSIDHYDLPPENKNLG